MVLILILYTIPESDEYMEESQQSQRKKSSKLVSETKKISNGGILALVVSARPVC